VRVLPIDVYGAGGVTTTFDVANAVARAAREGADVINLSLGGAEPSALLQRVLRQAVEAGALPVAAAGNQPTTAPTYPAAYGETLAVTAGDRRGAVASYANRGEFVDVIAPGTSIVDHNGRAYVVSGTSAATASVSGLATALAATGQPMTDVRTALEQKLKFTPPTEAPKRP
jgi:thermitase